MQSLRNGEKEKPKKTVEQGGFGINAANADKVFKDAVDKFITSGRSTWREASIALNGLSFRTSFIHAAEPIAYSLTHTQGAVAATEDPKLKAILVAVTRFDGWEVGFFTKGAKGAIRMKRVLARRMGFIEGDTPLYPQLQFREIGESFLNTGLPNFRRYFEPFLVIQTLDYAMSQLESVPSAAPSSPSTDLLHPFVQATETMRTPPRTYEIYERTMGGWKKNVLNFIQAVAECDLTDGRSGLFNLLEFGSNSAVMGVTINNITTAALYLKEILAADLGNLGDGLLETIEKKMCDQAVANGTPHLVSFFESLTKTPDGSDTISTENEPAMPLAFAVMVSPVALLVQEPLYRHSKNVGLLDPLLIRQRLGHLQYPHIFRRLESDIWSLITEFAHCTSEDIDLRQGVQDLAVKWRELGLDCAVQDLDARFFYDRLVLSEQEGKKRKRAAFTGVERFEDSVAESEAVPTKDRQGISEATTEVDHTPAASVSTKRRKTMDAPSQSGADGVKPSEASGEAGGHAVGEAGGNSRADTKAGGEAGGEISDEDLTDAAPGASVPVETSDPPRRKSNRSNAGTKPATVPVASFSKPPRRRHPRSAAGKQPDRESDVADSSKGTRRSQARADRKGVEEDSLVREVDEEEDVKPIISVLRLPAEALLNIREGWLQMVDLTGDSDEEMVEEAAEATVSLTQADTITPVDLADDFQVSGLGGVNHPQISEISDASGLCKCPGYLSDGYMRIFDVKVSLPRSLAPYAKSRMRTINDQFSSMDLEQESSWIVHYTARDWETALVSEVEKSMSESHAILIHGTTLHQGWDFTSKSARRIRPNIDEEVEAQEYVDPETTHGGVTMHKIPLRYVIDGPDRQRARVFNVLQNPQQEPVVDLPRISEFDTAHIALRSRRTEAKARGIMGLMEYELEDKIAEGFNWAIISQQHAFSDVHWDTAGAWTAIAVLHGAKYWAVRRPETVNAEIGINDVNFWRDLAERDLKPLPGNKSAWIPLVLNVGEVLILPPCTRHLVYTVTDGIMAGIHFYNFTLFHQSFCGYVLTAFTGWSNTNAEHTEFISPIQAHASLWRTAFTIKATHTSADDPAVHTKPDITTPQGLMDILSLACSLAFNDIFYAMGKGNPYRGALYGLDLDSFADIWHTLSSQGYVHLSGVNSFIDVEGVVADELARARSGSREDSKAALYMFAGLTPVLFHFGRALVALAYSWNLDCPKHLVEEAIEEADDDDGGEGVSEDFPEDEANSNFESATEDGDGFGPPRAQSAVYKRVVVAISLAVGLDVDVVRKALGVQKLCMPEIRDGEGGMSISATIANTKMFPEVSWTAYETHKLPPPYKLWHFLRDAA